MKHKTVSILGGGIAGLTTALALQQIGIQATIFESSPEIKPIGAGLGLSKNALMAFEVLGIHDEICQRGNLLPGFAILDHKGNPIKQTDNSQGRFSSLCTIHRADLQQFLLSQLDSSTVLLGKKLTDVDIEPNKTTLNFEDGSRYDTDYLIVADGIHSAVRKKLIPQSLPRYAGYTCWRSVLDHPMHITQATETWGSAGRFGIVPLRDHRTYWYACINASQNDPHFKHFGTQDLITHFQNYHDPILKIIQHSDDKNLLWNDLFDIKPLQNFAFDRIVLIGDAAHASTPNLGQGAGQAVEDAVVLAQCMKQHQHFELVFKSFEQLRLSRTQWITDTSLKLGQLAQIENPLLIKLRNAAFKRMPKFLDHRQMKKIEAVSFSPTALIN
ncbi:FAD-dependent monooxygenase [Reichenbachiella agarivorans]|uniref:FAD-dependent monooxygenase n=1 Tax=Reichenbachiella agarivorans TaxID=2979464 RepID=A0ABY6CNP9_9BACT|nr:FAD-dependent monooxygenase [Reichenbachiella agarivorans]UXP30973.1 FAD-dependent monooxygenase [Reichenbachiella agarivorans]